MSNLTNEMGWDLVNLFDGFKGIPTYIMVYVFIYIVCATIGVCGNITVILTISLSVELRKNRNAFIVGLAFADLMVSGVTMPASIAGILLGRQYYVQRPSWCIISSIICAPGCVASMYSIASIAISRYYYIGNYSAYVKYFTFRRTVLYIGLIWVLSFFVHVPNHLGWGESRYSFMFRFCTLDTDLLSYAMFYALFLLIAIVTTFVFYARIYNTIRHSTLAKSMIVGKDTENQRKQKDNQQTTNHRETAMKNELKIIKASFKIFIMFLLCWLPVSILILIHLMETIPAWAYLYAALLAHCNSTLNFIVYFLEDDSFRRVMKKALAKLDPRKNRIEDINTAMAKSYHIRTEID